MKTIVLLSTASLLAFAAPALAFDGAMHRHGWRHATSSASTTPAVRRPGDAALRASNRNGGTGGKNSASNGS